jgi:septation ring formation regulator EzrA
MPNGVLGLLKDIHSDKKAELEMNYYNKRDEIEKRLAKENPKFQELTGKIKAREEQIVELRDEIQKLQETKNKLFPGSWDAKDRAEKILKDDYLKLRVKTTLNGIPKEKVKKLVEDFHNKDYLAVAMGA